MSNLDDTVQKPESVVENTLSNLRALGLSDPSFEQALNFLAPAGFRPCVQFSFLGTKPQEVWSPENGEIRIRFERVVSRSAPAREIGSAADRSITDILAALNEAEAIPGRTFVAIKWFRDDFLPAKGYEWAKTPDERQNALARAISEGWILTSKIQNPMSPLYPTTTIRVNRQKQSRSAPQTSRFRPVPISGEPLSSTLLRDRGPR
jgi:hypothetical protein